MSLIGSLIGWLFNGQEFEPQPQESTPPLTSDFLDRLRRAFETGTLDFPPEILNALLWAWVVIIGVIALLVISGRIRRTPRRIDRDVVEERERIGSWSTVLTQLKDWVLRLLGRKRAAAAAASTGVEDDLAALSAKPEWSGTLSIRQIYAQLQKSAGKLGYPRPIQQTPIEYLQVLSTAMPGVRAELEDITNAYLDARYGPLPASDPVVQSANRAWMRVQAALRAER
jgi:hypothetical protein